jgi:hypothetical protein
MPRATMAANNDPCLVGDLSDPESVRGECRVASTTREAMGGGILGMRSRHNSLRHARSHQVTLCECGQPLRTLDDGGHVRTLCCGRIVQSCCGD